MNKRSLISMTSGQGTVYGRSVRFTRRWYGKGVCFTWVEVFLNNAWHSLGDPWRAVTPPRKEMCAAIQKIGRQLC